MIWKAHVIIKWTGWNIPNFRNSPRGAVPGTPFKRRIRRIKFFSTVSTCAFISFSLPFSLLPLWPVPRKTFSLLLWWVLARVDCTFCTKPLVFRVVVAESRTKIRVSDPMVAIGIIPNANVKQKVSLVWENIGKIAIRNAVISQMITITCAEVWRIAIGTKVSVRLESYTLFAPPATKSTRCAKNWTERMGQVEVLPISILPLITSIHQILLLSVVSARNMDTRTRNPSSPQFSPLIHRSVETKILDQPSEGECQRNASLANKWILEPWDMMFMDHSNMKIYLIFVNYCLFVVFLVQAAGNMHCLCFLVRLWIEFLQF